MQEVQGWLTALPPAVLYLVLAVVAAVENVFPPIPADTVVAFGAFLAARGHATLPGALLSTLGGNMVGAMGMYGVGRRYGAARLERRLAASQSAKRLQDLYGRYGALALFVSRFLPGVRAVVPPFAGALRIPAWRVLLILGSASAIWYGTITVIAYRVGADWPALEARMKDWQHSLVIGAALVTAIGLATWLVFRRRKHHAR
ncbi:MAG: DedA family protein [Gemmatimonadaceae bacterium]